MYISLCYSYLVFGYLINNKIKRDRNWRKTHRYFQLCQYNQGLNQIMTAFIKLQWFVWTKYFTFFFNHQHTFCAGGDLGYISLVAQCDVLICNIQNPIILQVTQTTPGAILTWHGHALSRKTLLSLLLTTPSYTPPGTIFLFLFL